MLTNLARAVDAGRDVVDNEANVAGEVFLVVVALRRRT
jgi:hypothetical protein